MLHYETIHGSDKIQETLSEFLVCFPSLRGRVSNLSDYCKKLADYAQVVAMYVSNEPVGFLAYYANNHAERIGYITLIGIIPQYRRNGFGNQLLQYCFDAMSNAGMNSVQLEVDADNLNAVRFYSNNGFEVSQKARETSYYMKKELGDNNDRV